MMSKHTPTPYSFSGRAGDYEIRGRLRETGAVTTVALVPRQVGMGMTAAERYANIQFIVRACNNFEKLLNDREILRGRLAAAQSLGRRAKGVPKKYSKNELAKRTRRIEAARKDLLQSKKERKL